MSLNHLKHIPCPAGDKCTAFKCMFQHRTDLEPKEAPSEKLSETATTQENSHASRKRKDDEVSADTEAPRKRRKSTENGGDLHGNHGVGPLPAISQKDASNSEVAPTPASLKRSVSPPPVAEKTPTRGTSSSAGKAPPVPQPSTPKAKAVSSPARHAASSPASAAPSPAPLAKKPAKSEALNPRSVKPPPAIFESRFKLLRLVHSELVRLNNELKKAAGGETSSPSKRKVARGSSVKGSGNKPEVKDDSKPANGDAKGGDEKDKETKKALSDQQLITLALDEEETVALSRPTIYATAMRGVLMKYKRMTPAQWEEVCIKEIAKTDPDAKEEGTPADQPKEIITGLTPSQEVYVLRRLLTPINKLSQHGYVASVPDDEDVKKAMAAVEMAQNWEKCARCDRRFQVFPGRREEDGALTSGSECLHHPGKTFFQEKQPGDKSKRAKRYRCCGEAVGDSAGCTTGDNHVFKVSDSKRLAAVINFAETPANPELKVEHAVCFDCEMGYTVYGLELIRLTATSWPAGEELLDILVRPKGEVLDLNSRYSGVWPQDIANAEPYKATDTSKAPEKSSSVDQAQATERRKFKIVKSPEDARDLFFSLITPDTPLVGHGLENDLNAMRIIHPTLVDTVLLYPHRLGLPYRHGLKMLAARFLEKHIQLDDSAAQGHDSAEDARTAGELARLKVKEEWETMRRGGWKLEGGEFVPPAAERV